MSPVAAACASPESAPALGAALVAVLAAVLVALLAGLLALLGADELACELVEDEPHAAAPQPNVASRIRVNGTRDMAGMLTARAEHVLKDRDRQAPQVAILSGAMLAPSLLILEDEPRLRDVLVRSLRAEGFTANAVASGGELLAWVERTTPDAVVIDIGLPDADGRDVCQALRARGVHAPVLFLTARDALTDRLAGFSAGGDDYVTKPFDIEEVAARLHALVRRAGAAPTTHAVGGLELDPAARTVASGERAVSLTPTEFRLLAALAARPGRPLARLELVRAAWPHGAIVHDNTLDVYIARLRRKLRQLPTATTIVTVHGTGYRMQC
jgi:two-component system response regulator MprA